MKKKMPRTYEDIAERKFYVYCELEYNGRKRGLLRLLSDIGCIEGVLVTKLDNNVITITGEFDPDRLFMFVGEYVRIKCFRKGKCFSILYLPEPVKKENNSGNTNSRANNYPNSNDYNGYYGAPYGYYGGNGYQNYYTQPSIFGGHQLLLKENREATQVEKPVSPTNSKGSTKKSKEGSEGVGGCCLM